jgi:hypothetical protein
MPLVRKPSTNRIKSAVRQRGRFSVLAVLARVQQRHEDIVKPWKESEDKPEFIPEIKVRFGLVIGQLLMRGEKAESAGITVWQLLEHGTKIRFMKLSEDWASKTSPKQLSSGPGGGITLGLDLKDPEGGITKREWAETVAKAEKPNADRLIKDGWASGFRSGIG